MTPLSCFSPADGLLEVIEVVDGDGHSKRVCELGICPGQQLTVVRQGDPAIVSVGSSRLALAGELIARVFVRPVEG